MTSSYFLDKSEIYMVINKITGKRYIGQVKCYYRNGSKAGKPMFMILNENKGVEV